MADENRGFVYIDFIIFGITIAISIGIGFFYGFIGGKQKTTAEYILGNRQMSIVPVALSLMVSFESSITMLGVPAEIYVYGIMFWINNIGFAIAAFVGLRIVVSVMHPLGIKSVYEYLQLRYKGKAVRILGTTTGLITSVLYMGIVLYGPGTALEAVTEMPFWVSVTCVASASVIYTSISIKTLGYGANATLESYSLPYSGIDPVGGIKAVIWTDVFQCVIMFMGIFAVLIKGTLIVGGVIEVFDINADNGRLYLFNFDPDPTIRHTFWSVLFGSTMRYVSFTFNQASVQRVSSMATQKEARQLSYFIGPAFFITLSLATLEGVVAYAYYTSIGCDPLTSKQIRNPNQILPYMVSDIFRTMPGMAGLFMAAIFSGSLSTLSSSLSSLSTMTVEDYIKPFAKNISDQKLTVIAKLTVPVYGLIAVGISFLIATFKGPMSQIASSMISGGAGPTSGLFLYSAFFPWATKKGAIVGIITSVIFTFWIVFGQTFSLRRTPFATMPPVDRCPAYENVTMSYLNVTMDYTTYETTAAIIVNSEPQGLDKLYSLSYQWIAAVGLLTCIVIGIITSVIEGLPQSEDIDVRYVLPYFDHCWPCLPKKLRKRLYFGVKFEQREEWLKKVYSESKDNEMQIETTKF